MVFVATGAVRTARGALTLQIWKHYWQGYFIDHSGVIVIALISVETKSFLTGYHEGLLSNSSTITTKVFYH